MEHNEESSKEDGSNFGGETRITHSVAAKETKLFAQSEEESSDEQHGKKQTPDPPVVKRIRIKAEDAGDEQKQFYWDIMRDTRAEEHVTVSNDRMLRGVYVTVKVTVCIFLFLFVLTTAVVSKVCLVLITSNLFPPRNDTSPYWLQKTANYSISYPTDKTNVQWIWAMVLIISAPYFFTSLSCGWKLIFKNKSSSPGWNGIIMVMILETLHSLGLCVFVFMVLPSLDPFASVLVCFQVALVPGLLGAISRLTHPSHAYIVRTMLITGVLLQMAAIGLMYSYYILESQMEHFQASILTLAPILVPLCWWDNYLNLEGEKHTISVNIARYVNEIHNRRKKFNFVGNLWKICVTLIFPLLLFGIPCQNGVDCINAMFGNLNNLSTAQGVIDSPVGRTIVITAPSFDHCDNYLPILVAVLSIVCSGLCYNAAKIGCNILAQIACMSLPLAISSPVATGVLIGYMGRNVHGNNQTCDLPFPYWSDEVFKMSEYIKNSHYWMIITAGICGYTSFLIISYHTWLPGMKRLQKSEQLFAKSSYCGVLLCQSIPLNRKRLEDEEVTGTETSSPKQSPSSVDTKEKASSVTPLIYICATMWHETKTEMKKLMQSILRLDQDQDQRNRRHFRDLFLKLDKKYDNDFYNFEVHIFFDDAFKKEVNNGTKSIKVNGYVKDLLDVVQETTGDDNCLKEKIETAYGGRLEWCLPHGNKMIAHLKNKEMIRVRKRWSQVMYMYYFLGHKILGEAYRSVMSIDELMQKLETDPQLREQASNTFLLALDGDVDFKPEAVKYLMDRMRKFPNVGAACGRIHPTGNGPVVWYQKFEYAVSHWLQKVAEDTLGCVLCSPGCFSLFRGSALMDNNIMKVYTTPPTEGRHHVQYDQVVLMYNSKRIISLKTILDLLPAHWLRYTLPWDYCEHIQKHGALRHCGTPGQSKLLEFIKDILVVELVIGHLGEDRWLCTLLLQQGYRVEYVAASDALTEAPEGFNEFFNQRRRWSPSTMANILDLLLDWKHVIKQNPDISTLYIFYQTFLMLSSILTPGTIFLMLVGAIHTAYSAIDLWVVLLINILPLVVFVILCFNATSETQLTFAGILSIAYSLVMMLVLIGLVITIVDLGFCSVTTIFFIFVASVFVISALLHPQEFSCIFHGFLYFLAIPATSVVMVLYSLCNLNVTSWGTRETAQTSSGNDSGKSGNRWYDVSRGALRCLSFSPQSDQGYILQKLDQVEKQLNQLNQRVEDITLTQNAASSPASSTDSTVDNSVDNDTKIYDNCETVIYDWIREEKLNNAALGELDGDELKFWRYMIKKYLSPLVQTDEEKQRVEEELTALRNKVCLFFILANAMFICIIFTLQQITMQTKSLSIPLPCVARNGKVDYVEPISLTFTFIFGVLLLVQFVCMLLHRFGTLVHICARTEIFKSKMDDDKTNYEQLYRDLAQMSHVDERPKRVQSIFLKSTVELNKVDNHPSDASQSQSGGDTERESSNRNSFGDKCQSVVKFVKRRQTLKRQIRKDEEMKEIHKNFPSLSQRSHRAIFTLLQGAATSVSSSDEDTLRL